MLKFHRRQLVNQPQFLYTPPWGPHFLLGVRCQLTEFINSTLFPFNHKSYMERPLGPGFPHWCSVFSQETFWPVLLSLSQESIQTLGDGNQKVAPAHKVSFSSLCKILLSPPHKLSDSQDSIWGNPSFSLPTIYTEANRMVATFMRCSLTGLKERGWCKNRRVVRRVRAPKSPSQLPSPSWARAVAIGYVEIWTNRRGWLRGRAGCRWWTGVQD